MDESAIKDIKILTKFIRAYGQRKNETKAQWLKRIKKRMKSTKGLKSK